MSFNASANVLQVSGQMSRPPIDTTEDVEAPGIQLTQALDVSNSAAMGLRFGRKKRGVRLGTCR